MGSPVTTGRRRRPSPPRLRQALSLVLPLALLWPGPALPSAARAGELPQVVDVPSRPAFSRPPWAAEAPAEVGQRLMYRTVLRTEKPGRLQVQMSDGRSFRLGGDAVLRLLPNSLELQQGQIIAWIQPGRPRGLPLQVRTRVATASINGTTVFVEASDTAVKLFGWEGRVQVRTDDGRKVELRAGEQISWENGSWQPKRRLTLPELQQRRGRSILLNGFSAAMDTLPVLERELGLSP
ncbi:MAG: FecR family protein [Synechococcaceae cyanobacterium]|nr:FecR family protein [Synechococcaceae cyanobacterium]